MGTLRERPAGSGRWELRVAIGHDGAGGYRTLSRTVQGNEGAALAALEALVASERGRRRSCRCSRCRADAARLGWRRRRDRARTARRRRLPFGPLETAAAPSTVNELAQLLGVDRTQVYRWRRLGVSVDQADTLACRLDLHPSCVWPGWADELEEVAGGQA